MEWYYSNDGEQAGPVTLDQLTELFQSGAVKPSDLVWNESMTEWTPIGNVGAFAASSLAKEPAAGSPVELPISVAPPLSVAPVTGPGALPTQLGGMSQQTDGLAITSLILGILSMACCLGLLTGIPGAICGHIALGRIKRLPNLQGSGLAIAGLILSYLGIAFSVIYLAFGGMAVFLEETLKQIEAGQP